MALGVLGGRHHIFYRRLALTHFQYSDPFLSSGSNRNVEKGLGDPNPGPSTCRSVKMYSFLASEKPLFTAMKSLFGIRSESITIRGINHGHTIATSSRSRLGQSRQH